VAVRLGAESFEGLADEVAFCLENIRHPQCTLAEAGRFYEEAAEALRAHAVLRLLVDADGAGFSSDLVMSGHARRGYLRRCTRYQHADYHIALSRSGSMLDAVAGDDVALAAEIFRMSPGTFRRGEEYEDDFCWQRFLGLLVSGAPPAELDAALTALDAAAEGSGARLAVARALRGRDPEAFEEAFRDLLAERQAQNEADAGRADEEVAAAAGTQIFIEGIAVLKIARLLGISIAGEYAMCPTLALLPRKPATPADEFASP
jgi:hypothetical protein